MTDRKLATVRRIANIEPIEGADKIVCVTVDGWKLVSGKDNGFNIGDLVIYFEIDSFLPVIPQFEWMRDRCYKNTSNLGEGFLVRTIKLRGQVSQGLIVPLTDFSIGDLAVEEGSDLTEFIGVKKYEKPIPAELAGTVRGSFPSFICKTDQERAQNCLTSIKNWIFYDRPEIEFVTEKGVDIFDTETGRPLIVYIQQEDGAFIRKKFLRNAPEVVAERSRFEATLKLDGSSMTVYYNEGQLGVCSRNNDLKRVEGNSFWQVAVQSGLIAILADSGYNIAVQGELMGPGVQGNREGFTESMMFIYDIWDIDRHEYLTPDERYKIWGDLSFLQFIDISRIAHVPVIGEIVITEETTVDDLLKMAEIPSISNEIAEGLVFKSLVPGGPSFKIISNKFLLKEKD